MAVFNPISVLKNGLGLIEGCATGNPVQVVASAVKLGKSAIPFADFVPGLEEVIDGALAGVLDAAVEPLVETISGTPVEDVVHELGENAQNFYRVCHNDIPNMIDSDDDGWPDLKGVLNTAAFASEFPDPLFDIGLSDQD